ncbi:DUF6266 family protein [Myroides sp. N17-2]|uniref:DUF6266 family protein n=1 Tax=Myroides sp. N17-2 TaxID=2030799 RepID=UPI000EFB7964|nr:DUF6266 family protein [Myroides sp. N17-2]
MAEIKQGILGPINGKVGTVVGVTWRGVNYIRAKPRKSHKKPTEKQLLQWDKMSLVSTFASKFKDFVNAHCPVVHNGEKWITGKEQMISRLMKQGVKLINGLQHITVESALLSIGNLAPAVIKKINRLKTGKFKVQWDNGLINALTLDTDSLTMMVYNEKLNEFIAIPNVGKRIDKYAHFSLPDKWVEGKIYFWSMWKAEDGSVHSTSCFHGIIELENVEEKTGNGELKAGNGEMEVEKGEEGSENGNQLPSEVIPIEQARDISLKNFLKEVDKGTEVETTSPITPPFKENKVVDQVHTMEQNPPIDSDKSSTEDKTLLSSVDASDKEKKLKKWTPPGYIRTVNKQIIKQPKDSKPTVQSDQANEGVFDGVRSILEVPNISDN